MWAMRIAHAGYAWAKASVILGLMNLFTKGSGKSRRTSMQRSTIAPAAMPTYDAIFGGDSVRRSVGRRFFSLFSISLLSRSLHHAHALRKSVEVESIGGRKGHIILTKAATPATMIRIPAILLTHLSPPVSSFF